MREISLENTEKLSRKELKEAIIDCFQYAREAPPVDRLPILQQAAFYSRELERRHDSWVSFRDLFLECMVIVLICWEIGLAYKEIRIQGIEFGQEAQIMANLEKSSSATSQNLVTAATILKTMNDNLQHQLDFYYEPSVVLTHRLQSGSHVLDVHNYGRSVITLLGLKFNGKGCSFQTPLTVSSGVARALEPWTFINEAVRYVVSSDANSEMTIYFKAENGREFLHRALMVRVPIAEGSSITIERQKTELTASNRELETFAKCAAQ